MIKKIIILPLFFLTFFTSSTAFSLSPKEGKILTNKIVQIIKKRFNGKEDLIVKIIESSRNASEILLGLEELRSLPQEKQKEHLKNESLACKQASWFVVKPMEQIITDFRRLSKILKPLLEECLGKNSIIAGKLISADHKTPIRTCLESEVNTIKKLYTFCEEVITLDLDLSVTLVELYKKAHEIKTQCETKSQTKS
jgi:hypothetical protein